jgi:flagellar biogenesis protein FliO
MKNLILIVIYVLPYAIIFALICAYVLVRIGKKGARKNLQNHMLFIYKRKLCQTLKSQQNERSNQ